MSVRIILVFLLSVAISCVQKKKANVDNLFSITPKSGRMLLDHCEVSVILTNGSSISSGDERYEVTEKEVAGATNVYFRDSKQELDFSFSYKFLDSLAVKAGLTIINHRNTSFFIDRIVALQGSLEKETGTTKALITSENWQDDKIIHIFSERENAANSMFTVALKKPSVAAGFLAGKKHFNHFTIKDTLQSIRFKAWGEGNGCELPPGKPRSTDPLFLSLHDNSLQQMERFAGLAAVENNVKLWPENRVVWCTWYAGWNREKMYSYKDGIARGIEDNIPYIKANLYQRGAKTVRICDDHIAYGDWHDNTKAFPKGFSASAKVVRNAGLTPGIWYPVFWASTKSAVYQKHPEWFAMEKDGSPYFLKNEFQNKSRLGEPHKFLVFDASVPEVQDYFENIATSWRERGFKYVTNDFLAFATAPPKYHDPTFSKAEVLRAGMEAVKRGLGDDIFYRTIGGQFGTCMGLSHDVRISGDSHGDRPFAYHRTGASWFYNHKTWINDPSAIVFMRYGEFRNLEWNKMWVSWIALAGTVMTYGEQLDELPAEYINIYKKIFPPLNKAGRPLDIWENQPYTLWGIQPKDTDPTYCLFGVFDLDGKGERNITLNLDEIYARTMGWKTFRQVPETYLLWDFWNEELYCSNQHELKMVMPVRSGRVFALRQYKGFPQLLGTNGHFSMGALETKDVTWDNTNTVLSGKVRGNGGDATTLFFYIPDSYKPAKALLDDKPVAFTQKDKVLKIKVPDTESFLSFSLWFEGDSENVTPRKFVPGTPAKRY